MVTKLY